MKLWTWKCTCGAHGIKPLTHWKAQHALSQHRRHGCRVEGSDGEMVPVEVEKRGDILYVKNIGD